jgi:hypothetical protein
MWSLSSPLLHLFSSFCHYSLRFMVREVKKADIFFKNKTVHAFLQTVIKWGGSSPTLSRNCEKSSQETGYAFSQSYAFSQFERKHVLLGTIMVQICVHVHFFSFLLIIYKLYIIISLLCEKLIIVRWLWATLDRVTIWSISISLPRICSFIWNFARRNPLIILFYITFYTCTQMHVLW